MPVAPLASDPPDWELGNPRPAMPTAATSSYRPDIDGLRAVAVVLVVAFHCGIPGVVGGFIGVDVFFVVSGYLITGLLLAELNRTSTISLVGFYARRVRRLMPAAVVMVIAVLLLGACVLAPQELTRAGQAARATAVYLANVFFAVTSRGYFVPDVRSNPFLHMWSLGVEEQFYAFWPVLLILGARFSRGRWLPAHTLLLVTAASLTASVLTSSFEGPIAFYGLHTRAWEFGVGGLACCVPGNWRSFGVGKWAAVGWIGLLGVVLCGGLIAPGGSFPGWVAILPVVASALLLISGAFDSGRGPSALLAVRPMRALGKWSYSWYLWHWPLLVIALAIQPRAPTGVKIAVALLALLIAALSTRWIENPVRFSTPLARRPVFTLALGAASAGALLALAMTAVHLGRAWSAAPGMAPLIEATGDIAKTLPEKCVSMFTDPDPHPCAFGDVRSKTVVVLFGDSHAYQWFNPLEGAAQERHWRLVTLLKPGCPAADMVPPGLAAPRARACGEWHRNSLSVIDHLHPALVVMSSAASAVARPGHEPGTISLQDWQAATQRTLAHIAADQVRVLLLRDTPSPGFDVPGCLSRAANHPWFSASTCDFPRALALNDEVSQAERASAGGLSGVAFLDPNTRICPAAVCPAMDLGMVIYRDYDHLAGSYARSLAPLLRDSISAALPAPSAEP